jgi:valyl-tRNA synthetase
MVKLPSAYQPNQYEGDIYRLWERNEVFKPVNRGGEGYFSLDLPPPNANGDLHMGHALTVAIEDTLARYHRMQGRETLFVPGADHAGFETWVVFEKKLNEQGKSRFDFSREELYTQVWDFVQANKHNFEGQLRALGASVDWTNFTFTLDGKVVETAYATFNKMWHDGLIYRGKRIVNFCTFHGTSFSDIEVIHEEEDTKLWHIAYPFTDGSGEVVIATTRPETKLGQSALMVNPKDPRYKNAVGKQVNQPLVPGKPIPVIADEYVDMKFGTGVVTVTPAHDPNDFEVAQRHKLGAIELITTEGKMSDNVPEQFRGMSVMDARGAVEKALAAASFLRKVEPYRHSVAKCYKCGTVIEPLLREQWFVSMRPLAEKALKQTDKISFYPASKKKQLEHYLTEVRDWNISRQIAWGIPIPAFVNEADPTDWIFDTRVDSETIEVDGKKYHRDPDVFDTWFSSGQWPYVTLNYPDGEEFKKNYPLSLMETGGEILYQWVARMLMLGLYVTGEIPFKNVYIHGYVMAEDGAKMSKSLGNVINPLETIATYGSDALRMGLLSGRRPGVNQGFHPAKIVGGRNFANKLWNIARFIEEKVDAGSLNTEAAAESLADHWIISRAGETSRQMSEALENYRLSEAYEQLYDYIWHDLADWYIEASKTALNAPLLAKILQASLKLAHPFAPFVSETIWQTLSWQKDTILAVQKWDDYPAFEAEKAQQFADLTEIITEARAIVAAVGASKPTLFARGSQILTDNAELVTRLGRVGAVKEATAEKGQGVRINKAGYDVWLDIDTGVAKAYLDKLIDQKSLRNNAISRLESRLENPNYVNKAPEAVVTETKRQLDEERALLIQVQGEIDTFSKLIEPAGPQISKPVPAGPAPSSPPVDSHQTTEHANPTDQPPSS